METEIKKYIHDESFRFRQMKIKELLDRKEITDLEHSLIDRWALIYGGDAW